MIAHYRVYLKTMIIRTTEKTYLRLQKSACDFSDVVVKVLSVLNMTSDCKTPEEKLREQKSQQFVSKHYMVCACV